MTERGASKGEKKSDPGPRPPDLSWFPRGGTAAVTRAVLDVIHNGIFGTAGEDHATANAARGATRLRGNPAASGAVWNPNRFKIPST